MLLLSCCCCATGVTVESVCVFVVCVCPRNSVLPSSLSLPLDSLRSLTPHSVVHYCEALFGLAIMHFARVPPGVLRADVPGGESSRCLPRLPVSLSPFPPFPSLTLPLCCEPTRCDCRRRSSPSYTVM